MHLQVVCDLPRGAAFKTRDNGLDMQHQPEIFVLLGFAPQFQQFPDRATIPSGKDRVDLFMRT